MKGYKNFSHFFFKTFLKHAIDSLFLVDIKGIENLPKDEPFIIAANHSSLLDPPLAGVFLDRQCAYLARQSLTKSFIIRHCYKQLSMILVDSSKADIKSMKQCIEAVKKYNLPLVIFPEGTRSYDGNFLEPKAGVGMLALKLNVPVVPLRIKGAHLALGRSKKASFGQKIEIVYGKPLNLKDIDSGKGDSQRYLNISKSIMQEISKL